MDGHSLEKSMVAREVNDRVLELARTFGELVPSDEVLLSFVCECVRESCYGRVELTPSEYQRIRARPDAFLLLPEHEPLAGERELSRTERYAVVRRPPGGEPAPE